MIKIGEYQTLTVLREMPQGYYLEDEEENEVLLPRKYITEDLKMDDLLKVFVYCDSSGREVATTEKPMMTVNQFASLTVTHVNDYGAFCDWGINKELFVPFSNQHHKLKAGDKAVVYMYLDEVSERLVGTTRLKTRFQAPDSELKMGQKVKCLVYGKTDLGYKVIIDQKYDGLIYANEVKGHIQAGDIKIGYLKPIREDGKLDVSLDAVGHQHIEPNAKIIMDQLLAAGGQLPFTDKSDPDEIRKQFGISKKMFKKAVGNLYRQKQITLEKDGIKLV